jgi:hypothetical protein
MIAVRITDPLWVGNLGEHFVKFVKKIGTLGISSASFHSYLTRSVQFGGNAMELWVVFESDEHGTPDFSRPLAFAHWLVRDLPHVGKTYCDFIHNWSRKGEAVALLIEKWIEFADKFNARLFEGESTNKRLFQHFRKLANANGFVMEATQRTNFIAWKETAQEEQKEQEEQIEEKTEEE